MGMSHHGNPEEERLLDRFRKQMEGEYRRTFSQGRLGADDDGDSCYMIASDDRRRAIIIRFPRPTEWIGLGVQEATELRDQLTERILALRGVDTLEEKK